MKIYCTLLCSNTLTFFMKKTSWPVFMGFNCLKATVQSHHEETVYFIPLSPQEFLVSAVSRAILKPVYQFGIPNSNPHTLKSADFWCKFSSTFLVAEPRERCFELFRTQNSQKNSRVSPLDPTGEGLQHRPRLPGCTSVFLLATLVEKPATPKNCWVRHCW